MDESLCKRIFAVDDEPFTIQLWVEYREKGSLPGVQIRTSNRLDAAVSYADDVPDSTLYVLDSRAFLSDQLFNRCQNAIRNSYNIDVSTVRREERETAAGVFVAGLVKAIRPNSKIILLTAFLNHLEEIEGVGELVGTVCDERFLKKMDDSPIREAIKRYTLGSVSG